ncbi:conserved hypothetical protein (plasmid) [Ralstonia solanacearum Po82]|uniref:Uncharacterized protein n=1 Tax=Ralstonia solanacearum (strain Po82) TaxID=1031711 RepID=F6G8D5_RALS8|nr:conserved hypothetical protein [Ralstonia solanacearum Po82]AMP72190.1 hypothetical protein UW163_22440 [Ralstonia solanacearum]AMP76678.1 hypothetical protein RALBFv3_21290 [Ralstonia solanacearum]
MPSGNARARFRDWPWGDRHRGHRTVAGTGESSWGRRDISGSTGSRIILMPTDTPQPPWVAFPALRPETLAMRVRQGVAEPWFDQVWRPYWTSLTPIQRTCYLDAWEASPEWREAIAFVFETLSDLDLDQDAKASEAYLRDHGKRPRKKKRSFLSWLLKR